MKQRLPRGLAESGGVLAGGLLLLAALVLTGQPPRERLLSYLAAFLFFTGLSAGSLALLLVPALTGGMWGRYLRPPLLAAAGTLPLQTALAVPLVMGVRALYPWAQPEHAAHDAILHAQGWYLNPRFFVIRTVVYFALWWTLLWKVARPGTGPAGAPTPGTAAVGLILFALTTLFAATDWVMSLLPHWHSSTFGLMLGTGWMLAAAALAVLSAVSRYSAPAEEAHLPGDLGNLLLMFVLLWSYLAFMQYLTVWVADLPAETQWYLPRTLTSWRVLGWFLVVCNFAVPFAILLSRRAKRYLVMLRAVTMLLLLAQLVDALWLVLPSLRPRGIVLHWTDLFAWLGMGLLWAVLYGNNLHRAPDPSPDAATSAQHGPAALESQRG